MRDMARLAFMHFLLHDSDEETTGAEKKAIRDKPCAAGCLRILHCYPPGISCVVQSDP